MFGHPFLRPEPNGYPLFREADHGPLLQVNGQYYMETGVDYETVFKLNKTTKEWGLVPFNQSNNMDLPYIYGNQFLFSQGTKVYFGLSSDQSEGRKIGRTLSTLDVSTNQIASLPLFPGTGVRDAITFVVGSKGYVAGGFGLLNNLVSNQLWEFDFATEQWADIGPLPGGKRAGGTAFVMDGFVYVGLGYTKDALNVKTLTSTWVRFTPGSQSYSNLATFPGGARYKAQGFAVDGKVFLGWGFGPNWIDDFWEYNPDTDAWTQRQKCPGSGANNRNAFSLDNTGYVVTGWLNKFWRYSKVIASPG